MAISVTFASLSLALVASGGGSAASVSRPVTVGSESTPAAGTKKTAAANVAQVPAASAVVVSSPHAVPAEPVAPPSAAALVDQVEAAGIEPGPTWNWTMGTATACGAITGDAAGTGCTSWSSGTVGTIFVGTPTLGLVAHELANAEVEADATAALLSEVASAAGDSSWSPTDAVASCLVVHFLGFQDDASGPWQCPTALADQAATHIHDVIVTTTTTAVCGAASGIPSTLTFQSGDGTLTVTGPVAGAPPRNGGVGSALTVSGIGTFTAVEAGGTPVVSGTCQA